PPSRCGERGLQAAGAGRAAIATARKHTRHRLVAMPALPLKGCTIGVTADRRWQEQAELLARRGATVVHGPTIATVYLNNDERLRRVTEGLIASPPDFLVANTGIGMRAWF